ncbi:hypothetical protein IYY11_07260 [Methylocystis sp. H62]|uniref:hypothetical protein n=1 Tax=Methylocystis sp. H62 TaxID=2785789 RepID=UPI0018C2C2C0|nr:hypothetical protein [Methylocystis sp. H62]MBG0793182.1 hypothetical protein [Methylocystis sp. H62]
MPRYDLSLAQKQDAAFVESIADAIKPFSGDELMRVAFARYPGPSDPEDTMSPNLTPAQNMRNCLRGVNNEVMLRPFLSRVIEDQWRNDALKEALLRKMPDLVLAPIGLQSALQIVSTGVARLLNLIAKNPSFGAVGAKQGDEKAFDMVCRHRDAFVQLRDALAHLQALKGLHDALHILQVGSADWLDPDPDDDDDPETIVLPLAALAKQASDAELIVTEKIPGLRHDHLMLGQQTAQSLSAISDDLNSASRDAQAAGLEKLRQTLLSLPKEIDGAMFGLSRDLPIRQISRAFGTINDLSQSDYAGFDLVQVAMAQLGEALRGRVLEHAMWQATDVSLHALENILGDRDPSFLKPFVQRWQDIRRLVRYLSDAPSVGNSAEALVGMALDAYDRALKTKNAQSVEMSRDEAFEEIVKTFSAFKTTPRERFLAVDKALKEELALIGALQVGLDELLEQRVRETCSVFLTNP